MNESVPTSSIHFGRQNKNLNIVLCPLRTALYAVYFHLDGNYFTGAIPSEMGNLSLLDYLVIEGGSITGTIPSEIGNLSALVILSVSQNSLTGMIPSQLGNLSNLGKASINP